MKISLLQFIRYYIVFINLTLDRKKRGFHMAK